MVRKHVHVTITYGRSTEYEMVMVLVNHREVPACLHGFPQRRPVHTIKEVEIIALR